MAVNGSDVVQVGKDIVEVFKAAKGLKDDLDKNRKVDDAELAKIAGAYEHFESVMKDLPTLTGAECRDWIEATRLSLEQIVKDPELEDGDESDALDELGEIDGAALAADLATQFDLRQLLTAAQIHEIVGAIESAQAQVERQIVAQDALRIGLTFVGLAVDATLLALRAAAII